MEYSTIEIVKRIDLRLKEMNLKRQAVYDYAHIASNSFPNWMKNQETKIPAQALYLIAKFLDVSLEWLITGEDSSGYSIEERDLISDWRRLSPDAQRMIRASIDAAVGSTGEKSVNA